MTQYFKNTTHLIAQSSRPSSDFAGQNISRNTSMFRMPKRDATTIIFKKALDF